MVSRTLVRQGPCGNQRLNASAHEHDLIDATVLCHPWIPALIMGKHRPGALALSDLPIKRVVVALEDPNPRVAGRGITDASQNTRHTGDIRSAGKREAAQQKLVSFIHHITTRRPFVDAQNSHISVSVYTAVRGRRFAAGSARRVPPTRSINERSMLRCVIDWQNGSHSLRHPG